MAIAFIEEVAQVEQSANLKAAKQAPRMLIGMLSILEDVVVNAASRVYHRIYACGFLCNRGEH